MSFNDGLQLGMTVGVLLGIVIDRVVIPTGARLGDKLALVRHRRRSRVR